MSEEKRVSRRGYVKYAAAGVVVVAGAAAGAYYATRPSVPTSTSTMSSTSISAGTEMPEERKRMVITGRTFDAVSLDPHWTIELTTVSIINCVYDYLLQYDPETLKEHKLKLAPRLAKSWEMSPDGTTYTYYLQENAKFYPSGNPVDAEAVKFSFDRGWKLQGPPSFMFAPIKETKVLDSYTVQMVLKYPYAAWNYVVCAGYLGVVDPAVMEHDVDGDMGSAWLNDHSAGSGAFYMDHWTREKEVLLVRNPLYWGQQPKIEKVLHQNAPEVSVQQMMLEKGDMDLATSLTTDQAAQYEEQGRTDIVIERPPSLIFIPMSFNCDSKPLDDVRVRQAIKWALDYDGILESIPQGHGRIAQSFLLYGMEIFDESLQKDVEKAQYYLDVEKSKSLLDDAGYSDGFTVQLNYPQGVNFSTRWEDLALKVSQDLSAVGINCDLRLWEMGALVSSDIEGKSPGLTLMYWGYDWPDADEFADLWMGPWGRNMTHWDPGTERGQHIDDLVMGAKTEIDFEKRKMMYKELAEIMLQEGTFHNLYQPDDLLARRSYLKDFIWNICLFSPLYERIYKE